VGTAAGTLIGLQFVVMTLIAEHPPLRAAEAGAAFATPTIVHFSTVLLLSALLHAPWQTVNSVAIAWGLVGVIGVAYSAAVARRVRTQTTYKPDVLDWLFFVWIPLTAYAALAFSALAASCYPHEALFAVGALAILLLFTGIHNAWDSVAYHVLVGRRNHDKTQH
jgi:hypothetical protein